MGSIITEDALRDSLIEAMSLSEKKLTYKKESMIINEKTTIIMKSITSTMIERSRCIL